MIPRDPEKKPAQGAPRRIKPPGITNQGHENLLGHILGHGRIPGHMQREPVDSRLLLPVDLRECVFVSAGDAPQEQGVP